MIDFSVHLPVKPFFNSIYHKSIAYQHFSSYFSLKSIKHGFRTKRRWKGVFLGLKSYIFVKFVMKNVEILMFYDDFIEFVMKNVERL